MKGQTAVDLMQLERRSVENPSYTDGLYYGDAQEIRDRNMRIDVDVNAMARIGALCFVKKARKSDPPGLPTKCYPYHERTAERFKSDYEDLFGAGVPALDNTKPVVDKSATAHDNGIAARIDRGKAMRLAIDFLGHRPANVIIDFLVLCTPCEAYATIMPSGQRNQRQVTSLIIERLSIITTLARHWGYISKAA